MNDMKTTALWSTTHKVLLAADVFEGKACEETATPVAASRSALNSAHALLTRPDSRFFQRKGRRDVIARCLRFAATMRAVALGAVFASIGFACDHEAPVASAEGAIDEQPARGVRTDVGRTVSQTERARLVSPEPIPAPQQLEFVVSYLVPAGSAGEQAYILRKSAGESNGFSLFGGTFTPTPQVTFSVVGGTGSSIEALSFAHP